MAERKMCERCGLDEATSGTGKHCRDCDIEWCAERMRDAPTRKIVIVCGGRSYTDRETLYRVLDKVAPDVVVHGACGVDDDTLEWMRMSGADRLADDWFQRHPKSATELNRRPAEWKRRGRKAGPIRNIQMAIEFPTATVIAFPGGKGTANMVSIARKAGMTVRLVTVEGVLL